MINKKFLSLGTAFLFSIFLGAASLTAGAAGSSAIGELSGSLSGEAPAAVPAAGKLAVPQAVPDRDEDPGRSAKDAPKPGRDFYPVIEDAARVRFMMKLVSDIYSGAHLPYSQDGVTFKNKEGRLPQMPLGYYKEYTLITGDAPHLVTIGGVQYTVSPDMGSRGSERIVIGGGERIYYSPDHYRTFIELTVVY